MIQHVFTRLALFCAASILFLNSSIIFASNDIKPFEKIVFFGDSLSDNGNFYADVFGFMPKSPPYFKGRFTNGLPWSEQVEKYFYDKAYVKTTNYAVGGQTAIFHNPMGGYLPYTLTMSLDSYLLGSIFRDRSNTLFVIWIGANDYLPGIKDIDGLTTKVVDTIASTVDNLIYYGGLNVLIINLPDLSLTPFGQQIDYKATLQSASLLHNIKLAEAVMKLQEKNPAANIHLYQIDKLIEDFIQHPDVYNKKHQTHTTNVSDACWNGGYTRSKPAYSNEAMIANAITRHMQSTAKVNFSEKQPPDTAELARYIAANPALMTTFVVSNHEDTGMKPCSNADEYVFWDKVHPTAVSHQIISEYLIQFINDNYQVNLSTAEIH